MFSPEGRRCKRVALEPSTIRGQTACTIVAGGRFVTSAAERNPHDVSALSRRDAIVALLATASALSACGRAPEVASGADADALALLDELAENLLRLSPE